MGSQDVNSDPHACMAGTLSMELSTQFLLIYSEMEIHFQEDILWSWDFKIEGLVIFFLSEREWDWFLIAGNKNRLGFWNPI